MRRLEKTNITWVADVIDKLGWETQRPLDPKNVETCRGLPITTKPRPWTGWARDCQPNSCLPIPLVLLTMLGTTDGSATARAPRWRTTSRPWTERTGAGEDAGGGEYEG